MTKIDTDHHRQQVTTGPIIRTVLSLAIPVTLGMIMEVALQITDFFWVGKLGASAQDAITSSMVVIWAVFAVSAIIWIGVTALISRYAGAGDYEKIVGCIRQAMWLAAFIGLLVSVIGYLGTPSLLTFMGASDDTFAHALPYLRIFFLTTLITMFGETIFAIFRASGDTRTPMKIGITVVIVNMLFDPLFIFGLGPIPAWGVTGAALATAVAHLLGIVMVFRALMGDKLSYSVTGLFKVKPELASMLNIVRIGLPIGGQQLIFIIVYWFLIKIVHEFGESAGAAMGIGNRMESISYLICHGLSLAASTMVGQNLGAGSPARAAKCAWGAAGIGVAVTFVLSVLFIVLPEQIAGVFTNDAAVLTISKDYLIILGLSQLTMAVEIILEGAFSGAGDTLPPTIVSIPGSLARIPLAYYLAFELEWGINGVWWTLTITTTLKALALAYWFYLGHWKQRQVT